MTHPYNALLRVLEEVFAEEVTALGFTALQVAEQSDCIHLSRESHDKVNEYKKGLQMGSEGCAQSLITQPIDWFLARNQSGLTVTFQFYDPDGKRCGGRAILFNSFEDEDGAGQAEKHRYGAISVSYFVHEGKSAVRLTVMTVRKDGDRWAVSGEKDEQEVTAYFNGDAKLRKLKMTDDSASFDKIGDDLDMLSWSCIALRWINDPAVKSYAVEETPPQFKKAKKRKKSPRIDERPRIVVLSPDEAQTLYAKREHQGGKHASPRPHVRRAHRRVLKHPRYKHARGRVIEVDDTKVGWKQGEEFKVGRTIYAVMPKRATSSPLQGMEI